MVVRLCGELEVMVGGRRVELPGRQGRLLFAYLMEHRRRPVAREDLIDALWEGEQAPADERAALNVLLARLRGAVGRDVVVGRSHVVLALPEHTEVDVDVALSALQAARDALAAGRAAEVIAAGRRAVAILERPLLPELEGEWRERAQRELDGEHTDALALIAEAALAIGRAELHTAEHAARAVIAREPFEDTGYRLLMRAQAAAGNVTEALRTYEELRRVHDELGGTAGQEARDLHADLLRDGSGPSLAPAARPATAGATRVPLPVALRPRGDGGLYGRDPELERLRAWRSGDAGVRLCVLGGDAGIGKTRLAGELAREAHPDGTEVLYGRCDSETALPYQPFVEALRHRLAHRLPALDEGLAAELGELSRLAPELRAAGYAPAQPAVEDPALRRRQVFDAVSSILAAAAQDGRGLLLVLDDLHWADRPTAALLRHVLRLDVPGRLAVLAVHRHPDLAPDHPVAEVFEGARRQGSRDQIVLDGLRLDAVGRLTAGLAPRGASPRFLQALHTSTGGNPLFVEELLLELQASGRPPDKIMQAADLADIGVPRTVHVVVARRLSRLGADVARVLQDAAVIGPRFEFAVLEALAPERDPLPAVEAAQRAGLLIEPGDGLLGFPHEIVRQAIYHSQSAARRVRLHGHVARVLERDPEGAGRAAELARHWTAAREAAPARAASLRAAREATEVAAPADALRHYEVALRFWPWREEVAGEDRRDVLEAAAETARWAGAPARAAELADQALEHSTGPGDAARRGRLHDRRARYLWEAGDFAESLREYEDTSRGSDELPPSVDTARALARQALACMFQERFDRALEHARRALDMARTLGARDEESHALNTLGVALGMSGHTDEGVAALREALAIAQDVAHLEDECRAYVNLSGLLMRTGRMTQAVTVALDGYRFTRAQGLGRSGSPIIAANAIAALSRLGRWDEADALAVESLADEPPDGACVYLRITYGHLLALRGAIEPARAQLAQAEAAVVAAYEPELTAELAVAQADLALAEGRPQDARRVLAATLARPAEGEAAPSDLLLRLLAMCMRAVPDPDTVEDRAWREAAAVRAREVAATLERRGALLPVARALAATIDAAHARLAGEPRLSARWAAVREQWEAVEDAPAAARARLMQAEAELADGKPERARGGVAEVAELARRFGAPALAAEAARLAGRLPAVAASP